MHTRTTKKPGQSVYLIMSGRYGEGYGHYYGGSDNSQASHNDPNKRNRQAAPHSQQPSHESEPYPTRRQPAPHPQQFMNYSGYESASFVPPHQHTEYQEPQRQQHYSGYFQPSHSGAFGQPVHGQGKHYQPHQLSPDLAPNLGNLMHNPTTQIGIQALSTIGQDYVNKNVLAFHITTDE